MNYFDVSTHAFISLRTITKLDLVDQSAPWCTIVSQMVRPQRHKKVSTFYANLRLVFVFARHATGSYPQLFQLTPRLQEILLENTFYIILLFIPGTSVLLISVSPSNICIHSFTFPMLVTYL